MSALALAEAALEETALQGRSGATLADIWTKLRIPATPQPDHAVGAATGGLTGVAVHANTSTSPPPNRRGLREAVWAQLSKRKDVTFVAPPLSEVAMVRGGAAAQQAANRDGLRLVASQERRLRALGLNDPARAAPFLEDPALLALERIAASTFNGVETPQLSALLGIDGGSMYHVLKRLSGAGLVVKLRTSSEDQPTVNKVFLPRFAPSADEVPRSRAALEQALIKAFQSVPGILEAPLVDMGALMTRFFPDRKLPFAERQLKLRVEDCISARRLTGRPPLFETFLALGVRQTQFKHKAKKSQLRIWCVRLLPSMDEEGGAGRINNLEAGHDRHFLAPTSAHSDGMDLSIDDDSSTYRPRPTMDDHNDGISWASNNDDNDSDRVVVGGLGVLCGAPTLYRLLSQALVVAGSEGIMSEALRRDVALDVKAWERRLKEVLALGEAWAAKEQVGRNKGTRLFHRSVSNEAAAEASRLLLDTSATSASTSSSSSLNPRGTEPLTIASANNVPSSSSSSSSSRRSARRSRCHDDDDEEEEEEEEEEDEEEDDEEGFDGESADVTALLEGGSRTSQAIFRETVILNALAEQPLIEFRELLRRIVNLENENSITNTVGDTFDKRAGAGLMLPSAKPALYRSSSVGSTCSVASGGSLGAIVIDHRTLTNLLKSLEARKLVRLIPKIRVPTRRPCVRSLVARWALSLCPGEAEARHKAGLPPWHPPPANAVHSGRGGRGSSASSSTSRTDLDHTIDPAEALDDLARRLDAARSFVTPSGLAGTLSGGGADGTWAGDTTALPVIARLDPALLPSPFQEEDEEDFRSHEELRDTWDEEEAANGFGHGGVAGSMRPTPKQLTSLYRVRTRFDYVPGIMPRTSLFLRAILTVPDATTAYSGSSASTTASGSGVHQDAVDAVKKVNISALMCNLPLSQWLRVFGADLAVAAEYGGQIDSTVNTPLDSDRSFNRDVGDTNENEAAAGEAPSGKVMSKLIEAIESGGAGDKPLCCLPPYLFDAMKGAVQGRRAVKAMQMKKKGSGDNTTFLGDRYWAKILRRLLELLEHLGFLSCNTTPGSDLPTSVESSSLSSSSLLLSNETLTAMPVSTTTADSASPSLSDVSTSAYQCSAATEAAQKKELESLVDHHATHGHLYTLQPFVDTPLDVPPVAVAAAAAAATTPENEEVSAHLRFSVHDPASLEAWWGLLRAAALDPAASTRAKVLKEKSILTTNTATLPCDAATPHDDPGVANEECEPTSATALPAPAVFENVHQLSTRLIRALPEITQYLTWRVDNTRAKRTLLTYSQGHSHEDSNDRATKKKRRTSIRSSRGPGSSGKKGKVAKRQRKSAAAAKKRDSEKRWYVSSDESYSDSDKNDDEDDEDDEEDEEEDHDEGSDEEASTRGRRTRSRAALRPRAPSRTGLRNQPRSAVSLRRRSSADDVNLGKAPVPEMDDELDGNDDDDDEDTDSSWEENNGSEFGDQDKGHDSDERNDGDIDNIDEGGLGRDTEGRPVKSGGPKKKRRSHWWCQQQRALGLLPKLKSNRKLLYTKDPTALWFQTDAHSASSIDSSYGMTSPPLDPLPEGNTFREAVNLEPIEEAAACAVLQVAVYNRHLAQSAASGDPATSAATAALSPNVATAAVAAAMQSFGRLPERSLRAAYEALVCLGWVVPTMPGNLGGSMQAAAALNVHGAGNNMPLPSTIKESSSSSSSNSSNSSSREIDASSSAPQCTSQPSSRPLLGEAFESSILSLTCCCMASDLYWQLSGAPWRGVGRLGIQGWFSGAYYEADMLPPNLLSSIRTAAKIYARNCNENNGASTGASDNDQEHGDASLPAISCSKIGGYAAWTCDTFTGGTTRLAASVTTSDQASAPVLAQHPQSGFMPAQAYRGGIAPEIVNTSSSSSSSASASVSSSSSSSGGVGAGRTSPSDSSMPFAPPKQKGVTLEGKAFFEAQRLKLAAKAEADLFLVPELNQIVVEIGKADQDEAIGIGDGSAVPVLKRSDSESEEVQQEAALLQYIAPPWLSAMSLDGQNSSTGTAGSSAVVAMPGMNHMHERTPLEKHLRRSMVAICLRRPGLPVTALCAPKQGICTLQPASAAALLYGLVQDGICWLSPMNLPSERGSVKVSKSRGIFDSEGWESGSSSGHSSESEDEDDEAHEISSKSPADSDTTAGAHLGHAIRSVRLYDLLTVLNCVPQGAPVLRKPDTTAALSERPLCVFLAPGGLVRLAVLDADEGDGDVEEKEDTA